ncbi:MAG: antibiotic biosynthesis monooxygenase [Cypionkella sp.]|jgi:quinol monooxygenase YgiN|nr:antibiotic biosynthesis monooxygenase [Cypionkella sp.]
MHVVTVHFQLHPGQFDGFLAAMRRQRDASLAQSAGCRQFDIAHDGKATIFLYEVYDAPEDFARHLTTPHFKQFAVVTAAMVATKSVAEWQLDPAAPGL